LRVKLLYKQNNTAMIKTMKSTLMLLVLAVALATGTRAQSSADVVLDKWTNEDQTRVIEFVKDGSGYQALIRQAPTRAWRARSNSRALPMARAYIQARYGRPNAEKVTPAPPP
jgi:hypothetical protein